MGPVTQLVGIDSRILELSRPFPDKYIHDDGRGNAYVPHHVVRQRIVHIFGKPPKQEILREIYDGSELSGVVMRWTIDLGMGYELFVEEAGEADNPQAKTNGARLKSAVSDGVKRCAMGMTLGLHLWAQQDYFLFDALHKKFESQNGNERPSPSAREEGQEPATKGSASSLGEVAAPAPKPEPPKDPALTAIRIAARKLAEKQNVDIDAECLLIGKKLEDMDKSDVELLMTSSKDKGGK